MHPIIPVRCRRRFGSMESFTPPEEEKEKDEDVRRYIDVNMCSDT